MSEPNQSRDGVKPETASIPVVSSKILWPFILLTSLFAWWGLANNMTDTLLAAFKRIMSFDDGKTAWIQVVCYAFGYGCFAIPGAMFMKRFTYKSGVLLGLGLYVLGTILFFPALWTASNPNMCYFVYLGAILITFAGLSILETACNPYILALGAPETATRRLNLAQSFNPLGSIVGVVVSQMFILSQLSNHTAAERAAMEAGQLAEIQHKELFAISATYASIGLILLITWLVILLTRMPKLREEDKRIDFFPTWGRLLRNKNYVAGVLAQFFYVGAQIACWSFTVRYCMAVLNLDALAQEGPEALRNAEPAASAFYSLCSAIHFDAFLPKTAEQAGATYYVFSLILFVVSRFFCTWLMKFFRPSTILAVLAFLAVVFCCTVAFATGAVGVYALIGVSGCMSLMFPTIFAAGTRNLGEDTKMGGAGMVMAICGAALLTQIQGMLSDKLGNIAPAYLVPGAAFGMILLYALLFTRRGEIVNSEKGLKG